MVIISSERGGRSAAATVRDEGFSRPVMIVGGEPASIDSRHPAAVQDILRVGRRIRKLVLCNLPADWCPARGVELPGQNRSDRD